MPCHRSQWSYEALEPSSFRNKTGVLKEDEPKQVSLLAPEQKHQPRFEKTKNPQQNFERRHIDQHDMVSKVTKAKTGQPKHHENGSKENAKEREAPSKLEEQASSFLDPNQKLAHPHLNSRTQQTGKKI